MMTTEIYCFSFLRQEFLIRDFLPFDCTSEKRGKRVNWLWMGSVC